MHNSLGGQTFGRLKSDFRYSAGIVYNNFPWPDLLPSNQPPAQVGRLLLIYAKSAQDNIAAGVLRELKQEIENADD